MTHVTLILGTCTVEGWFSTSFRNQESYNCSNFRSVTLDQPDSLTLPLLAAPVFGRSPKRTPRKSSSPEHPPLVEDISSNQRAPSPDMALIQVHWWHHMQTHKKTTYFLRFARVVTSNARVVTSNCTSASSVSLRTGWKKMMQQLWRNGGSTLILSHVLLS